jgi:hypothetical protein
MPTPARRNRRYRTIGSGSFSAGVTTFLGFVDAVSVWRTSLSAAQIAAGMHDTSSQWATPLPLSGSVDLAYMFEPAPVTDMLPASRSYFDGSDRQSGVRVVSAVPGIQDGTTVCSGVCVVPSPRR